jgi:hypothetical protein
MHMVGTVTEWTVLSIDITNHLPVFGRADNAHATFWLDAPDHDQRNALPPSASSGHEGIVATSVENDDMELSRARGKRRKFIDQTQIADGGKIRTSVPTPTSAMRCAWP